MRCFFEDGISLRQRFQYEAGYVGHSRQVDWRKYKSPCWINRSKNSVLLKVVGKDGDIPKVRKIKEKDFRANLPSGKLAHLLERMLQELFDRFLLGHRLHRRLGAGSSYSGIEGVCNVFLNYNDLDELNELIHEGKSMVYNGNEEIKHV